MEKIRVHIPLLVCYCKNNTFLFWITVRVCRISVHVSRIAAGYTFILQRRGKNAGVRYISIFSYICVLLSILLYCSFLCIFAALTRFFCVAKNSCSLVPAEFSHRVR